MTFPHVYGTPDQRDPVMSLFQLVGGQQRENPSATYESAGIDTIQDRPCKLVLSEVGNETECARITCLHDDAEQSLEVLHALFNGINVALGWPTLVAGTCRQTGVNM